MDIDIHLHPCATTRRLNQTENRDPLRPAAPLPDARYGLAAAAAREACPGGIGIGKPPTARHNACHGRRHAAARCRHRCSQCQIVRDHQILRLVTALPHSDQRARTSRRLGELGDLGLDLGLGALALSLCTAIALHHVLGGGNLSRCFGPASKGPHQDRERTPYLETRRPSPP
jgi:hypothetical protein